MCWWAKTSRQSLQPNLIFPTKNFGDDILDQGISCRYFKYYTYQFNMYLQYLPTKGSDKPYRFGDASVSALGTWFLCFSYYRFCFV